MMPQSRGRWVELFWVEHQDRVRLALSLAVLLATLAMHQADLLKRFEYVLYDYRFHFRGERACDPRIAVIEIADDSIAKIGRWPWGRDWHAALVQALTEFGARAVVFDVIFSESSPPEKDLAFERAIARSGRVYLAQVIEGGLHPDSSHQERNLQERSLLCSLPQFSKAAKGSGHINIQPDIDGVMRRIPLLVDFNGRKIPQLSLAVAMDEYGVDPESLRYEGGHLVLPFSNGGSIRVPTDEDGDYLINWAGPWNKAFAHYSYIDVITSYSAVLNGRKPAILPEAFRNKICFVGVSASALFDIRPTSLEPAYPAVGVNLTILNNLLEKRFIRKLTKGQETVLLALVFLLMLGLLRIRNHLLSACSMLGVLAGCFGLAFLAFRLFDVWVCIVYPVFLVMAQSFLVTVYNQIAITVERMKLLNLATRDSLTGLYNIGHFKLLLKAEIATICMRREKSLSILMGDVDDFKKINDTYGHQTGDQVLREVAAAVRSGCRALDVAARYGGEEFIVMLPGANIDDALKIAEKIRKSIHLKVYATEQGDFKISISIGVTQVAPDEKNIDAILARVDRALYSAKRTGKNKVVAATDSPRVQEQSQPP